MKNQRANRRRKLHRDRAGLGRSERLRLKIMVCVLGVILLAFLIVGRILIHLWAPEDGGQQPGTDPEPAPHIPVVRELHNVWIMDVGEEQVLLFCDGEEARYPCGLLPEEREDAGAEPAYGEQGRPVDGEPGQRRYLPPANAREQVADVVLTDGMVTELRVKDEKLHGKVLGADDTSIELEEYGKMELTADCRGYRIYNTLAMCTQKDLAFGYDFADFVVEDGKICGILMAREEVMQEIRVLLKTADFEGTVHQELVLTADTDFCIRYGGYQNAAEELHNAGDEVTITADSAYFSGGRVTVAPQVLTGRILLKNVSRSQGVPAYRGYLELAGGEDGFAVINVVPLEEYLYSVVPSEMPASYPGEALRAQAICARTYAYGNMLHAGYPACGAHVDDSTAYQVYNNIAEQERTTTAVKETYGQLLYTREGELAGTYYYSTSCGVGSDANVWKTEAAKSITYLKAEAINLSSMQESRDIGIGEYLMEEKHFAEFITAVNPDDFECGESWYRWSYEAEKLDPEYLCEVLKKRYQVAPGQILTLEKGEYVSREIEDFTKVQDIYVAVRGAGGVADELVLETDNGTYKVVTEHNIRYVLCDGKTKVKLQNGRLVSMPNLLPSGFFILETGKDKGNVVKYTLTGGGFGHGVGMSQNAARAMAGKGFTGEEILLFFYDGCTLQSMYGEEELRDAA